MMNPRASYPQKNRLRRLFETLLNPAVILVLILLGTGWALVLSLEKGIESVNLSLLIGRGLGSQRPVSPQTQSLLVKRLNGKKIFFPQGIKMVDATRESGMTFAHVQGGMTLTSLNEVIGSGACVADYDRDGFFDIYAVNGSGFANYYGKRWWWSDPPGNALYRNKGDGTFEDVASGAGVAHQGWGMGCAFGDYDNDGYPDLYVTNYGANVLYHNNDDGTFTDVSDKANVGDKRWGTSIVWFDYDRDGDLDLYVVNYVVFDKGMTPGEPNSAFKDVRPLLMNSALFDGEGNVLFRNNGDGTFTDVTAAAGVANSPGRSMGAVAFDYDNDGDQDLYIANDESRNILYRNNGDGTFTDVGGALGVDSPLSGMGASAGDYDNDGDMDIFFTCPQGETNVLYQNLLVHERRNYSGGKEGFADATVDAGLGEDAGVGYFGWSAEFVDMDNDGYLDIFVNNGHGMADFDNPQTTVGQRNQIFRNNSDGTFSDISDQAGEAMKALGSGRGAAVGDFDNDGDLDLFVVNNNGPAQYLRNQNETSHHWILISLKGVRSNADGVGARAILKSGNTRQIREARHGSGYLSQMDPRIHFGLGAMARVDELEVVWPSGIRQKFKDLAGDQWITITEGQPGIEVEDRRFLPENRQKVRPRGSDPAAVGNPPGVEDSAKQDDREDPLTEERRFRLEIIKAWGHVPGQESRSFLIGLLQEEDVHVRQAAVEALGDLGDPQVAGALTGLFRSDSRRDVRREIARALKNFPASPEGLGVLLEAVLDADAGIRHEAAHSLSEFFAREERIFRGSMLKKREVVTALLKAAGDAEPNVRKWSARALGLSESYRAVIPVRDLFKDAHAEVRLEAVRAAGLLRDKRAMKELFHVLDNDHETTAVRTEAILALQRLDRDSVFESMRQKVSQGSREDRVSVLKMLRLLLESGEAVLAEEAQILSLLNLMPAGTDAEMMRHRIQVEALLPQTGITGETIRQGMESGDPALRREAVVAGLKIRHPDVLARLEDFLRDPDAEIRQQALMALGQETSPSRKDQWIPVVEEMARHDESPSVRRAVMSVLLKLDEEKGASWIAGQVDKADGITKKAFMEILGELPRDGAVDLLLPGLEGGDVEVQTQAAHSLCLPRRPAGQSAVDNKAFLVFLKKLPDRQTPLPVRREILSCLRQRTLADTAVVSLLRKILGDPRDPLRLDVLRSLPHWKELNTADTLRKIFKESLRQ